MYDLVPPQPQYREWFAGLQIYPDVPRRQILGDMCSSEELTCAHCGFTARRSDIEAFQDRQRKEAGEGASVNVLSTVDEGFDLFNIAIRAPEWQMSRSSVDLLCQPCWHVAHMALPQVEAVGRLGLVPAMEQVDVVLMWRMMMLGIHAAKRQSGQIRAALDTFYATTQTALLEALEIPSGTATLSNANIAHWLAFA